MSRSIRRWLALSILFLLAFAIRLVGIDWHGTYPDETPQAAARILSGQIGNGAQFYPPFLFYLQAIGYVLLYVVGRAARWWGSVVEFRQAYFVDKTIFFVTGRIVAAAVAATVAPLSYALARQLRLRHAGALAVGVAMCLLPGSVFWAHIAKSDNGLGPAFLLLAWALFRLVEAPGERSRRIALGFAFALAVSFKQSAIFFIVPAVLVLGWRSLLGRSRAWLESFGFAIFLWIPLNIGIVIDPHDFLAGLRVQAQMSVRHSEWPDVVAATWQGLVSDQSGLPVLALIAIAAAPVVAALAPGRRWPWGLSRLFAATLCAALATILVSGSRQPFQLWLPLIIVFAFVGLTSAIALISASRTEYRVAGGVLLATLIACFAWRTTGICAQLLRMPMRVAVAAEIRRIAPPPARVLSGIDFGDSLPLSPVGATEERERFLRLAHKYGFPPPMLTAPITGGPDGYIVRKLPYAMGGLEQAPEDGPALIMGAWPIQREEWRLAYWLDRGVHIFVLPPEALTAPVYRAMVKEVEAQCVLRSHIASRRPVLFEQAVDIYLCGGGTGDAPFVPKLFTSSPPR